MGHLGQDLRYGLRRLARTPGFAAVAVLTLGLGIGANTAIFSLVDAVLLRPLPYPQPQQLAKVWMRFTGIGLPKDLNWVSPPEFRDLQTLNRSFASLAAMDTASFNVTAAGSPERVEGAAVALALVQLMKSLPYRTSTVDPATFIAVGAVLLVVALAACYVPAHRAMRVDPTVALRYQ